MRTIIDPEKCIGCTLCNLICPEVFKMGVEKAVAYVNPVPKQLEPACKDAAAQCPMEAIVVK